MTDKVPVVPPLSKAKIEAFATALLNEVQPEVFEGKLPVDVDAIYEFYIPERFGIETGYTDLSPLGPNVLGYTDASNKKSFVDKNLVDHSDITALRRGRGSIRGSIRGSAVPDRNSELVLFSHRELSCSSGIPAFVLREIGQGRYE